MRDDRIKESIKCFKFATPSQRDHYMRNRLKFIKDCVDDYNANLLQGETKITVAEMAEQLERKG